LNSPATYVRGVAYISNIHRKLKAKGNDILETNLLSIFIFLLPKKAYVEANSKELESVCLWL